MERAVLAGGFGESKGQSHEQVLVLIHELVGNFDLQKERGGIDLVGRTSLLMLTGLNQVGAVAGAIERDFALLAAALRTNAPVHSGTEPLLLADFTDRADQRDSCSHYAWVVKISLPRPVAEAWRDPYLCGKRCGRSGTPVVENYCPLFAARSRTRRLAPRSRAPLRSVGVGGSHR